MHSPPVYFIKSRLRVLKNSDSHEFSRPSLNTSQIPPPGNTLHYTLLLPKKTSCCLTKCFLPLLGCNFSCVQLSDISCQSAASSCGPVLRNAAKERPSEQNSGLLKATAGSWASQIFIKLKCSHRVSNLTASCEGWSPLLRLVVVMPSDFFSPMCRAKTESWRDLISLNSKLQHLGQRSWSVKLTHAKCVSLAHIS